MSRNYDGMWPPPKLAPEPEEHNTAVVREGSEFGWECSCGDEATGFEDYDAADSDSDEHRQSNY